MTPIKFTWNGEAMVPAKGYAARAERQYAPSETYTLEVREERSSAEHNHYFAAIADAYANLSDAVTERLRTPDHLRKWALIETGWFDETVTDCGSHEVALRMAAFTKVVERDNRQDYCEIIVRGPALVLRLAKSQSRKAMDKEDFRKSKNDILDLLSDMVGVNRTLLERYAERRTA